MTRYVALLRGINVGGNNKLPMADLRSALQDTGMSGVRTYIQSGNVVADDSARSSAALAAKVRACIATGFGLDIPVVGLSAAEFEDAVAARPFPEPENPKLLHAIVLEVPPSADVLAAVQAAQDSARAKAGGRDEVRVVGRVAYLSTPDGFGTSLLAKTLSSGRGPLAAGTARNWTTMLTLAEMVRTD